MSGLAAVAPVAVLPALYALAVALLVASRVREFADESDNLLGGYLIAHGERLYADYFSNHMPLPYFLAALPSLLGARSIEQYRVFTDLLLVVATAGIAWVFARRGLGWIVMGGWATLTVFAHTVQWGEMLHAGTCAAFGLLVAGLVFYTTPGLRFSRREQVCIAAAAFVALESELLSIYPLAVLGVCYLLTRPPLRSALTLGALVVVPHLAVVLGFAAAGALGAFVYDAYTFNQTYYAQFVMNGSIFGMLHDWEAQYRTYLALALLNPLSFEFCLVIGNVLAAWLVGRSRGAVAGVAYFAFVSLARVRNGGPYYVASYFSLALILAWAVARSAAGARRLHASDWIPGLLVLSLLAVFVVDVARTYELGRRPAYAAPEVATLEAVTRPGERIFVAPYDPYLYLAADRMPASTFEFYFPWQAADPRSDGQIMRELRERRPAAIVFRPDELVNGQYLTGDYAGNLRQLLDDEGYLAVSPTVFVPRERLTAGRAATLESATRPTRQ